MCLTVPGNRMQRLYIAMQGTWIWQLGLNLSGWLLRRQWRQTMSL